MSKRGSHVVRRTVQIIVLAVMLAFTTASSGAATAVVRVADINLAGDSFPQELTDVNGTLFFTAYDRGWELWKSDGTEAGTVLVMDTLPGSGVSPAELTEVGGTLFFRADSFTTGHELWKSDGTESGTVLVKDIFPGTSLGRGEDAFPTGLSDVNGTLFFTADDGTHGRELWKSDGSEAGTVLVKDINNVTSGSSGGSQPLDLVDVDGTLFFTANDGTHGRELWKSDGTEAGTVLVEDINPGPGSSKSSGFPGSFTDVGGTLFFNADDGTHGPELWKSDGSEAGTVLVKDISPGDSVPVWFTDVDGRLFFTADDGTHGRELWQSDGTEAGTVLVEDINPGADRSDPEGLVHFEGTLLFSANDGAHGHELWKSDGTEAGTVLIKDIYPGSSGSTSGYLTNVGGTVFFGANDGTHGAELWQTDGTGAGTVLVKDINPGVGSESRPHGLTGVNGRLFLSATDGTRGFELWKSDGSEAGTLLITDINNLGSDPGGLTNVGGTVFFAADDGTHGRELWKSDAEAGTVLVKDINEGTEIVTLPGGFELTRPAGSDPRGLTNVNGTLFFVADDGVHGPELWKSDGTELGTVLVAAVSFADSVPGPFADVDGTLYFGVFDETHGRELWKSDGTAAGTIRVKDINPGAGHSFAGGLADVGGTLFFTADDGTHGYELWKTDSTEAGTVLVKDIDPAGSGQTGGPSLLTDVGGTLFLAADDGTHGRELWRSDGTEAGTVLVRDINPGAASSVYSSLFVVADVNGTFFFGAEDGSHGKELWRSDGTEAGTVLVKDINPGSASSFPGLLANVSGTLLFATDDGTHGLELWRSDGTEAGTVLVEDVNPGPAGFWSPPATRAVVGGTYFFSAYDGTHGGELWRSDGTAAGTALVEDLSPNSGGSAPFELTDVNGRLFFSADDGRRGRELWKVQARAPADSTPPTITLTTPPDDAEYTLDELATADYSCQDEPGGSGLASCAGPVADGAAIDTGTVGATTFTVTAMDNAGNTSSVTHHYSVGYSFSGFLAPVNNPNTVNTGKAGRTYPVKWQLRDANGNFISALSAVTDIRWKATSCSSFTSDPADALETSTTGGTILRYDSAANQYVYNWATPTTRGCYSLFLALNDGRVYPAFFNLS